MSLIAQLETELTRDGWSIRKYAEGLEWWHREVWRIESQRSPVRFTRYLNFLTDPQPGSQEPFLEVTTTRDWPEERGEAQGAPQLRFRGWADNLTGFVTALNSLRQQCHDRLANGQIEKIEFRCTDDTYGMPCPHIPDRSVVILVQDGIAEVVRYEEPVPPGEPMPMFSHPINANELSGDALRAVLEFDPDIDLEGPALTYACPRDIADRAVWEQ